MDFSWIFDFLIAVLAAVAVRFVIPWVKANTTTEQRTELLTWVQIGVEAAQQLYTGEGQGAAKKEYVQKLLTSLGVELTDEIDALIESRVYAVKNSGTAVLAELGEVVSDAE